MGRRLKSGEGRVRVLSVRAATHVTDGRDFIANRYSAVEESIPLFLPYPVVQFAVEAHIFKNR
jgi:hypothetical protein